MLFRDDVENLENSRFRKCPSGGPRMKYIVRTPPIFSSNSILPVWRKKFFQKIVGGPNLSVQFLALTFFCDVTVTQRVNLENRTKVAGVEGIE